MKRYFWYSIFISPIAVGHWERTQHVHCEFARQYFTRYDLNPIEDRLLNRRVLASYGPTREPVAPFVLRFHQLPTRRQVRQRLCDRPRAVGVARGPQRLQHLLARTGINRFASHTWIRQASPPSASATRSPVGAGNPNV